MSEIKEGGFYDFYDFTKSVYIFSHMKTNLVDTEVQIGEKAALTILNIMTGFFVFIVSIKILIVFGYFLFFQALIAFFQFIRLIFKSGGNIYWKISFKNFLHFFGRIYKKIYTFNFYIFHNRIMCFLFILIFLISIVFNFAFNIVNIAQITFPEKDDWFFFLYIATFESNLFMEIICYIFYTIKNICYGFVLAFGFIITLNIIIIFSFLYTNRYEYLFGAFVLDEPERVLNIILFSILMIIKINCIYKITKLNKESKYSLFNLYIYLNYRRIL